MKNLFSFAPDSVTVNGRTFSAEYKERETFVYIIAHVEGLEHDVTVKVCNDDPRYPDIMQALHPDAAKTIPTEPAAPAEALDAAETISTEPAAPADALDAAETISTEPAAPAEALDAAETIPTEPAAPAEAQNAAETIPTEPAAPAEAQDAAETIPAEPAAPAEVHAPAEDAARRIPEKTFIGQTIVGKGWKILFDGDAERTRIIFDAEPVKAAVAALSDAKFYYSPTMKSYNKKLTFKAYRAAVKVSETLSAIYA